MSMTASTPGDQLDEQGPDGPTLVVDVDREERAAVIERLVCRLRGLEHVPDDEIEAYDARFERASDHVLDGRPVEIKSCLPWITDGTRRRRGRYWIRRGAHDDLVERDGVYVFVVVDPTSTIDDPEVIAHTTVPANKAFSEWLTWSPTGSRHRAEYAAQFSHARLFDEITKP